jgi:hypothetical protein
MIEERYIMNRFINTMKQMLGTKIFLNFKMNNVKKNNFRQ